MKPAHRIAMLALLLLMAGTSQADTCRSGGAAQRGAQAGYDQDTQAASTNAQKEKQSSDILNKCVGSITAVITAPQFPSIADIFENIKNKVCAIASEKINGAINDVNKDINQTIGDIYNQVKIPGNVTDWTGEIKPPITPPTIEHTTSSSNNSNGNSSTGSVWSSIWK
ncbi:hypothetical protein CEK28_10580 [Xenophilus sp. AP218F]|nr:hypothetical protein CEK28_10580 [Xenophilus sp. AP218F]